MKWGLTKLDSADTTMSVYSNKLPTLLLMTFTVLVKLFSTGEAEVTLFYLYFRKITQATLEKMVIMELGVERS